MSELNNKKLQVFYSNNTPSDMGSKPVGSLFFTGAGSLYLNIAGRQVHVSDVIVVDNEAGLDSAIKEVGKLYLTKDKNKLFTYTGTEFVLVSGDDTPKGYDLQPGNSDIIIPGVLFMGKQVYAAVLPTTLPHVGEALFTYSHSIPSVDIVVKVEGFAYTEHPDISPSVIVFNVPPIGLLDEYVVQLYADRSNFYIRSTVPTEIVSNFYGNTYVTIYYTKKDEI